MNVKHLGLFPTHWKHAIRFPLAARNLLYILSHRQENTHYDLCNISHEALAGMGKQPFSNKESTKVVWSCTASSSKKHTTDWTRSLTITQSIHLASVDLNLYLIKISIRFNNWLYWHHERPELVTDEDWSQTDHALAGCLYHWATLHSVHSVGKFVWIIGYWMYTTSGPLGYADWVPL